MFHQISHFSPVLHRRDPADVGMAAPKWSAKAALARARQKSMDAYAAPILVDGFKIYKTRPGFQTLDSDPDIKGHLPLLLCER